MAEYDYDSFGNHTLINGYNIGNTRLFTGREYDEEINLYYLRARYYDATTGRFISRDPIGQVDDVNLYAYVKNNPLGFVDLLGLAAKEFVKAYDSFIEAETKYLEAYYKYTAAQEAIEVHGFNSSKYKYQYSHFKFVADKWKPIMEAREVIAKGLHYARNDYNVGMPSTIEEAEKEDWYQPRLLWSRKKASLYHQDPDVDGRELKYLSSDGLREIIFYSEGDIVTDKRYAGTYNFFKPEQKIMHTKYDIMPYKRWGN